MKLLVGRPPQSITSLLRRRRNPHGGYGATEQPGCRRLRRAAGAKAASRDGRTSSIGRPTRRRCCCLPTSSGCWCPRFGRRSDEVAGGELVRKIVSRVSRVLADHYGSQITAKRPRERLRQFARLLNEEGNMVELVDGGGGRLRLEKRSCPYFGVADPRRTPATDQELIGAVVGRPVRRTSCRHYVPRVAPLKSSNSAMTGWNLSQEAGREARNPSAARVLAARETTPFALPVTSSPLRLSTFHPSSFSICHVHDLSHGCGPTAGTDSVRDPRSPAAAEPGGPERGVLGSPLARCGVCDDVAAVLRPDDFYADANQKLYAHLLAMHDQGQRDRRTLLIERLNDGRRPGSRGRGGLSGRSAPFGALRGQRRLLRRDRPRQGHLAGLDPRQHRNPPRRLRAALDPAEMRGPGGSRRSSPSTTSGAATRSPPCSDLLHEAFDRIDARASAAKGWACPPASRTSTI